MSSPDQVGRRPAGRGQFVVGDHFPHHAKNGHARIEGAIWILEDNLHRFSGPPAIALGQPCDVQVLGAVTIIRGVEQHLPGGGPYQIDHGLAGRGFTTAGLTHQTEGFALPEC